MKALEDCEDTQLHLFSVITKVDVILNKLFKAPIVHSLNFKMCYSYQLGYTHDDLRKCRGKISEHFRRGRQAKTR